MNPSTPIPPAPGSAWQPARAWNLWATRSRGTYWHIGEEWWVKLHGLSDPIVPVHVEVHNGDPQDPKVTHYGWENTAKPDKISMVWPRARGAHLTPWMSLNMCFGGGMQVMIDRGRGKMLALYITEGHEPPKDKQP